MAARTQKIDLRLTPEAKQTLYAAATAAQRSVTDFVLEGALAHAAEVLTERRYFGLHAERWADFIAVLDAPVRTLPRTQRLLQETSVFESERQQHDATH